MRTLDLGILAHVDAGKTTLTERLLFTTGAIDHVGSVDAGTTQTDSLDLERERGITIRSAVASFQVGDLAVNLVDTPGHPDFIAEVERVLGVLDGAVLVVSAVEGVQPQTPLLFRALRRIGVPTLVFVNKIDRAGPTPSASSRRSGAVSRRRSIPWAGWSDAGGHEARFVPFSANDAEHRTALAEALADHDEAILRAFVRDEVALSYSRLREQLAVADARGPRAPGVLRVGGARHRHRRAARRHRRAVVGRPRRSGRRTVSGRVFKIERIDLRRAGRLRAPVRGDAPPAAACARRRRRGREADRCPGVRPGRRTRGVTCSCRARWRPSVGSARSASAMPSATRRRASRSPPASRVRRWRPWCSPLRRTRQGRSARRWASSPSRTRSSMSARTTTATRSRSRCTARSRRR